MSEPSRVVFVSNTLPTVGQTGGQNVNRAVLQYLAARGMAVHYCCLARFGLSSREVDLTSSDQGPWSISLTGYRSLSSDHFRRTFGFGFSNGVVRFLRKIRSRFTPGKITGALALAERPFGDICQKNFFSEPDRWDRRHFSEQCARCHPDVIILDYAWLTVLFSLVAGKKSPLRIILTHDLIHRRVESLIASKLPVDVAPWTAAMESARLQLANILVIERKDEEGTFRSLAPMARIFVAPLAVEVERPSSAEIPGRCLFVGGWAIHNVEGLRWLLTEIWPAVLLLCPEATLVVCGGVCDTGIKAEFPGQTTSIIWRGRVESLKEEYERAEVCLVPLLSGSGFKTKLIEALAHGKTVVATPVGAQGISHANEPPLLIASDARNFVELLSAALRDRSLRQNTAKRAADYVRDNLSPETLYGPIACAIEERRNKPFD